MSVECDILWAGGAVRSENMITLSSICCTKSWIRIYIYSRNLNVARVILYIGLLLHDLSRTTRTRQYYYRSIDKRVFNLSRWRAHWIEGNSYTLIFFCKLLQYCPERCSITRTKYFILLSLYSLYIFFFHQVKREMMEEKSMWLGKTLRNSISDRPYVI